MSTQAYFSQAEKNVTALLNEKKFKEAYLKCKSILDKFPEEQTMLNLKLKIEQRAQEENTNIIHQKIKAQKENWNKNKYHEILNQLTPLLKLDPKNKKLIATIQKAQGKYQEVAEKNQKNFITENRKKLDKLLSENKITEITSTIMYLEKNNPGNQIVKQLDQEYSNKIIEKKINEKDQLIYSDKFEDIQNFLHDLKKIDKNNPKIKEIEEATKNRQAGNQIENKGEYLFKGIQHLDTLVRLKKFDKAYKVAEELLELDKQNKTILKLKGKAANGFYKKTREVAIKQINDYSKTFKSNYEKDKSKYIKI